MHASRRLAGESTRNVDSGIEHRAHSLSRVVRGCKASRGDSMFAWETERPVSEGKSSPTGSMRPAAILSRNRGRREFGGSTVTRVSSKGKREGWRAGAKCRERRQVGIAPGISNNHSPGRNSCERERKRAGITWTSTRFVCSRPAFSTNSVLYTRIYVDPASMRLAAVAAFQTRRGIDAPDASKVGREEMWGNAALYR